jgi:predicted GNAT family acetyltransferase
MKIIHNQAQSRFEVTVDGHLCVADYHLANGVMHMTHTHVPHALRGRGIASELVASAVAWAGQQQLRINPVCSYVSAWLRRHPQANG